jgi:SPP1 family predicted phage head-tail adaptor
MPDIQSVGSMRHYITIEQSARVADGMGGGTLSWTTFLNAWSRVEPMSMGQSAHGEGQEARVTHKVVARSSDVTGVTIAMRVNYGGRLFQIHGLKNIGERGRYTELNCEEGAAS